jgi:hypothetical protein
MEAPVLGNPELFPTEAVLFSHLGRARAAFVALFERGRALHPDMAETWKYYNDGKSWLLNVSRKKKTLFWLSVREGAFRITFYLGAKAEADLTASALPEELKVQYRQSSAKKLRPVTLLIKTLKDLEPCEVLLAIKIASS